MCQDLGRRQGLLLEASSGTVLAAVKMNAAAISVGSTVVAIAADFGERSLIRSTTRSGLARLTDP